MYKLSKTTMGQTVIILLFEDGSSTSFFEDPTTTDYQKYLQWVAEGNTPEPADTQE